MTIDLNRLKTMKREELVELAQQVGAPFHHKNSVETLVENIINKTMEQTFQKPKEDAAVAIKKEAVFISEEELEAVLESIKARHKAFSTVYDHESRSVTLRYNDGRHKHAETMSLSCPMVKFKRKAAEIAKGPLLLPTHREQDWEKISVNGKNAYTNVVLG